MTINECYSKAKVRRSDFASTYPCRACKTKFKKFILFEGHFAFNEKCRAKNGLFMQCYVCRLKFHHLSVLKYHLRRHTRSSNLNCQRSLRIKSDVNEHKVSLSKNDNSCESDIKTVEIVDQDKENLETKCESIDENNRCNLCTKSFKCNSHLGKAKNLYL